MASEKPDKKEKKDKKDKKRSETDGVHKSKKDKKDKKDKREKLEQKLSTTLDEQLQAEVAISAANSGILPTPRDETVKKLEVPPTLVPFAVPLADEKAMKKVLKTVRKSAKANTLKRGVKEVVKALRKSPAAAPGNTAFPGVVIIAGDISPMDVISHLPVLCEDHNVPYIFVSSRAELGAAARTKRPTSVVMVLEKVEGTAKPKKAKEGATTSVVDEEDDGEEYGEAYSSLVKLVQKETAKQAFW